MKLNMRITRGTMQEYWWERMVNGVCPSATRGLRGRAKLYAGRYQRSFSNMVERANALGYHIERTPGPHGGEWGATYRVTVNPLRVSFDGGNA